MIRSILLLALSITACQADETISGYADPDAIYVLTDLNGTPPQSTTTITFPETGKIAGQAPCNRYFANQTKPLPWFETDAIAATKMACRFLQEETKYFQALANARMAEIGQTTLILSNDDGPVLIFERQ